jgi:zinc finger protein
LKDLAREIVKSENATVKIPELELEIPACKKGLLSTIEGIISTAYEELEEYSNKNKVGKG